MRGFHSVRIHRISVEKYLIFQFIDGGNLNYKYNILLY
jgi:hypothetical protein